MDEDPMDIAQGKVGQWASQLSQMLQMYVQMRMYGGMKDNEKTAQQIEEEKRQTAQYLRETGLKPEKLKHAGWLKQASMDQIRAELDRLAGAIEHLEKIRGAALTEWKQVCAAFKEAGVDESILAQLDLMGAHLSGSQVNPVATAERDIQTEAEERAQNDQATADKQFDTSTDIADPEEAAEMKEEANINDKNAEINQEIADLHGQEADAATEMFMDAAQQAGMSPAVAARKARLDGAFGRAGKFLNARGRRHHRRAPAPIQQPAHTVTLDM